MSNHSEKITFKSFAGGAHVYVKQGAAMLCEVDDQGNACPIRFTSMGKAIEYVNKNFPDINLEGSELEYSRF